MRDRRLPLVILLVVLLVAAVVAGDRHAAAPGVREARLAATMPASSVRSSAWYCAGGPVGKGPSADSVTVSNTSAVAVPVAVDVMVEHASVREQLVSVPALASTTLAVSSYSKDPSAALVVQPLGPGVVVAQGFAATGDIASAPCATRSASSWYFAAGTSVTGAQLSLSVLDPYPVDTVVDVEAFTENGLRSPSSLQDLIVRAHSRLSVRIDPLVAQQKIVALQVHARNGQRIVATTALVQRRTASRVDASLSLGALEPSQSWFFADNRSRSGAQQLLVLSDPGETDATVRIALVSDVSAVIQPRVVKVPATAAIAVDLSRAVPAGANYTLKLHSSVPVVAETRATFDGSQGPLVGSVTELGTATGAPRWWFAGGPFTATGRDGAVPRVPSGDDVLIVMKPGADDERVAAVDTALTHDSHVRRFRAITRQAALQAYTTANRDNPALVAGASARLVSPAFAVVVKNAAGTGWLQRRFGPNTNVASVLLAANAKPQVTDDLVVFNPGPHTARISVVVSAAGKNPTVAGLAGIVVAPGRMAVISLVGIAQTSAAAEIRSSQPIVADRLVSGASGTTRSPGVPGP
jgi:hypothetical protein